MARKLIRWGEVYWVDLSFPSKEEKEKGIIHELQGFHPGVIVSNNQQNLFSPLITIIPLTSQIDKIYPFEVETNLNNRKGKVIVDQITTIDRKRLGDYLGRLEKRTMKEIQNALHLTLAFEE
ncbi:MAG: transcriptional modulator of MazE/toxin, MazF [Mycoplasmataceae bacterium CE_OT135]|nr:MAG: transcriptional modulator of MazE/toxin, MazF [Mycoplasmataceae bacterium CE_OT135]KLL03916.1 MAG: transcriptional modulator of MazE/toxin, MazF [Mycoplasmataceae bacterium CE_OT135]